MFMFVLIGCMDLARFFIIEHSLRTFTAEAARAALANTTMTATGGNSMASYAGQSWASGLTNLVPFLDPSLLTLTLTQNPNSTGVISINVTTTYNFTAIAPIWNVLNGVITDQTKISY